MPKSVSGTRWRAPQVYWRADRSCIIFHCVLSALNCRPAPHHRALLSGAQPPGGRGGGGHPGSTPAAAAGGGQGAAAAAMEASAGRAAAAAAAADWSGSCICSTACCAAAKGCQAAGPGSIRQQLAGGSSPSCGTIQAHAAAQGHQAAGCWQQHVCICDDCRALGCTPASPGGPAGRRCCPGASRLGRRHHRSRACSRERRAWPASPAAKAAELSRGRLARAVDALGSAAAAPHIFLCVWFDSGGCWRGGGGSGAFGCCIGGCGSCQGFIFTAV